MIQKPRRCWAAIAVCTTFVGLLAGAAPAVANTALAPPATFPTLVTVGNSNLPATIRVINESTAPENGASVTVSQLKLVPSCGTGFGAAPDNECPAGFTDPGVFSLSNTGTGIAGSCTGQTFNIMPASASGQVAFVPVGPPIVLAVPGTANDRCEIGFTFSVLKTPTRDAGSNAGIQTQNLTFSAGTSAVNGNLGTGTSAGLITVVQPPQISIVKSASPGSRPQPGGAFQFDLVVSNPGPNAITITSLNDNVYGNLGDSSNPNVTANSCRDLIGDTLAAGGGSTTCSFSGTFTGVAGQSETDVVTVVGTDEFTNTATDSDDATVTITAPAPEIVVTKLVSPGSLPAPGGAFTFTVQMRNPSGTVPITITSLTDNIYGNLATRPGSTCDSLIGVVLQPTATSAPCTFTGTFNGAAGASETDTVTVIGTSSTGETATDTDQATVTLTAPSSSTPPPPPGPPPPPAQQVPVTGGTARITGPSGCPTQNFSVAVNGSKIRLVVFYLDGKRVRSLTRPNSGRRFVLVVKPGPLRRGTHRVLAVTSFTAASKTKQRTLRLVFQKCGRRIVAPRFTA